MIMGTYFILMLLAEPEFWILLTEEPKYKPIKTEPDPSHFYINIGTDANGYTSLGFGAMILEPEYSRKVTFFLEYNIPNNSDKYWTDKLGFDFQKTYFDDRFGIGGGISMISRYEKGIPTGFSIPISMSYRVNEHFYLDFNYSLIGAYYIKFDGEDSHTKYDYSSTHFSLDYVF